MRKKLTYLSIAQILPKHNHHRLTGVHNNLQTWTYIPALQYPLLTCGQLMLIADSRELMKYKKSRLSWPWNAVPCQTAQYTQYRAGPGGTGPVRSFFPVNPPNRTELLSSVWYGSVWAGIDMERYDMIPYGTIPYQPASSTGCGIKSANLARDISDITSPKTWLTCLIQPREVAINDDHLHATRCMNSKSDTSTAR